MGLLSLPKRRIGDRAIPLSDDEHARFLRLLDSTNLLGLVEKFVLETELYLRGRVDGPRLSGTPPCGYLFLNQNSFTKDQSAMMHLDLMPYNNPPKIFVFFRNWKSVMPFSDADWNRLNPDRMQKNMVAIDLQPGQSFLRAVDLASQARKTFLSQFHV